MSLSAYVSVMRLVDDGVFFRGQAAEHDAKQADERDDVGAQDVGRRSRPRAAAAGRTG